MDSPTPTRAASEFNIRADSKDLIAVDSDDTTYKASLAMIQSYHAAVAGKMNVPEMFKYAIFFKHSVEFGEKSFRILIDELEPYL